MKKSLAMLGVFFHRVHIREKLAWGGPALVFVSFRFAEFMGRTALNPAKPTGVDAASARIDAG